MSRQRLFPTKSRYQVAICLLKLAASNHRAATRSGLLAASEEAEAAALLAWIALLCHLRLVQLMMPVIFEPKATTYRYYDWQSIRGRAIAAERVRGWRKRHPDLLNTITKEQKPNGN